MNCIFCELLKKQRDNETFIREMHFGVLHLHRNQLFRGRCIYIFNHHIEDFTTLDNKVFSALNKELLMIAKALKTTFHPPLINIAILGNKARHLHWHVIPRYKDDPNWGNPPWPNEDEILTKDEYHNLSELIRNALRERKK